MDRRYRLVLRRPAVLRLRGVRRPGVAPVRVPGRLVEVAVAFGDRGAAEGGFGLAQVQEHLALADLGFAYDTVGRRGDGEAGRGDIAELLVLVRQGAALDLAVQGGTADPGREVAPVRAGDDRAAGAVRAGGGDVEPGGDQAVTGLDDAGVP